MHNQTSTKYSSNSEDIIKSTKNFLEKPNTKRDSSKTVTSKVKTKVPDSKTISKE